MNFETYCFKFDAKINLYSSKQKKVVIQLSTMHG